MSKTILEKINELQIAPATLDAKVQPKVQAMIISLIGTDKWTEFVNEFIDKSNSSAVQVAQLARLTLSPSDPTNNNPDVQEAVAYLFANSMCGGTTGSRLHENIDGVLDKDIDLGKLDKVADPQT